MGPMEGQPVLPGLEPMRHAIEQSEARKEFVPVKCASCEFEMDYDYHENRCSSGDEGTSYDGQPLCENCYGEDEDLATLRVFSKEDPGPRAGEQGESNYGTNVFTIGSARNMTSYDGDIGTWSVKWIASSAWRGYYAIVPHKDWVEFHSDCALFSSADERQLAEFDYALRKLLTGMDITLVRAVSRTSNVCASNVDYFVEKKHLKKAQRASKKLAEVYRDPVKFNLTAITGKDPENADFNDHVVAAVGAMLLGRRKS